MLLRRGDAQANILAVARVMAGFANWETMLTRPTWAVLMERTGFSRSTVAAHLAWLRSVGLLGLVAGGTTPQFSPGVLLGQDDAHEGNDAAVYVLCAPAHLRLVALPHPDDAGAEFVDDGRDDVESSPVTDCLGDTSRTPSPSRSEVDSPARVREIRNLQDPQLTRPGPAWSASKRPASKADRALAALEARRREPVLAHLSTPYVAALFREWHLADWTLADVLTALKRRPDGEQHRFSHAVRNIPGWVRSRLQAWRTDPTDPTSPPMHSPSALLRAEAIRVRALQRAKAEVAARIEQSAVSAPDEYWAAKSELRRRLAERRRAQPPADGC